MFSSAGLGCLPCVDCVGLGLDLPLRPFSQADLPGLNMEPCRSPGQTQWINLLGPAAALNLLGNKGGDRYINNGVCFAGRMDLTTNHKL